MITDMIFWTATGNGCAKGFGYWDAQDAFN